MLSVLTIHIGRCVPAQDLWKLNVIVLKDDIDAVLLFLGKLGVAHYMSVDDELKTFAGLLERYEIPCEVTARSNILTRVDRILEGLELNPEELISKKPLPHEKTLEKMLVESEQKLSEIEGRSRPLVEALVKSSNVIKKIDQTLRAWKMLPKKMLVDAAPISSESAEAVLLEVEHRLSDVEKRFNEIDKISAKSTTILTKIEHLRKKLRIKITEVSIEKVALSQDEKFLEFLERTLSEIDESSKMAKVDSFHIKELMTIRTTVTKIMEQVPENKADLIKQILKLRSMSTQVRRSIKSKPELKAIHTDLLAVRDTIRKVEALIEVESNIGSVAETVYFKAWVPKPSVEEVTDGIGKITKGKYLVKAEPPTPEDTVPTVIKPVPRILEAFEKLTFSLGHPRPDEINPVLIMAVTFPFLFGVMFADVGQGAILLIAGVLLSIFRRRVDINKVGDITRYFLFSSGLLILSGISAMFFGFLFGEFFGPSGIIHPILLGKIGPFYIGGFDPMHEPLNMLRFSIFIGVILLSLGVVLRVINNLRRQLGRAALISICWLWLLLGGFFMWIYWGGISNFTKWFAEGLPMFLGLTILPASLIAIISAIHGSIMEGIDFSIEVLIESLDHTISFGRLAALFLTHSALNQMFLILSGAQPGYISLQNIPILMVGTILALSLEGLVVFVHCLRLHWVEIFPEFYSAKGIPFKPLKLK